VDLQRENDVEQLRRIANAQQIQIKQLMRVLSAKCQELEALKGNPQELQQTLALLNQLQKQAQAQAEPQPKTGGNKPRKDRATSGPTEQPELPIDEKLFELDEPDRTCPSCGLRLEPMAGQCEESELIDFVEISYRLVRVKQQKYVCRCGGCVETAPGPERAIKGGRYSLAFAIKVALDKYLDHIPLARQQRILARHGVVVTAQTLWDQLYALGMRLVNTAEALFQHALAHPVIGLDQTGWPKLDGKGEKPWQMWCVTAPGIVCHKIRDDKGADTFRALVGKYRGVIVCDALKTHEAGARGNDQIQLAGCWAHVFRKFEEALPNHPEAQLALNWIGQLYAIDERAGPDLPKRAELRKTEAPPVLAELKTWLWSQAVLKTLSIGKAAAYVIANWDRLTLFASDPLIPLDNNGTERGIRGPVVGRKNHYGSRSRSGTVVAATLYTLIETAKLHHVKPTQYLLEAVRAADRGEVLFPWQLVAEPVEAASVAEHT
jgi:transposase